MSVRCSADAQRMIWGRSRSGKDFACVGKVGSDPGRLGSRDQEPVCPIRPRLTDTQTAGIVGTSANEAGPASGGGEILDSDPARYYDDLHGGEICLLFVPFTPGAAALRARIATASPEERRSAVDELVGIGEVLHELIGFEEESESGFQTLPREYQDWIISLISQLLARLRRDSRLRP